MNPDGSELATSTEGTCVGNRGKLNSNGQDLDRDFPCKCTLERVLTQSRYFNPT